jgi:integrase
MPRAKLTESYIKSIPAPTGSLYELHWDTEVKGLTVRVTNTGAKHFVLCYTFDGRNKKHTLGRWVQPASNKLGAPAARELSGTLAWARWEAQKLILQVRGGIDPTQQKKDARAEREAARQEAAKEITVSTLVERYLEEHSKPNKRTWKEDDRRLNRYIVPAWGKRKAKSITRADISALVSSVATKENPHTGKKQVAEGGSVLALVSGMFSFALDQGIIDSHPGARIKVPGGKPPPRTRVLTTPKELRVLWRITEPGGFWTRPPAEKRKTMTNRRNERFMHSEGDAIRLLLLTGARASEVAELPWTELDLDAATWLLPAARSKNGLPNLVPLLPEAVAILRRRLESRKKDDPYVFPGPQRAHMTDGNLSKPLKRVCARLSRIGIASFTPHDLRRTVETGMAAAKVPKEWRDRVLNHIDASVGGKHYNMYDYLDEKREALEKWWRRLDGMLKDDKSNVLAFPGRAA